MVGERVQRVSENGKEERESRKEDFSREKTGDGKERKRGKGNGKKWKEMVMVIYTEGGQGHTYRAMTISLSLSRV